MTSLPILIPKGYTPHVAVGDHVTMGQILATATITREEQYIDIPCLLALTRRQARLALQKNPGDILSPGDIIARRKRMFGKELRVVSDAHGTIKRYERDSGKLVVIRSDTKPMKGEAEETEKVEQLVAPLEGTIGAIDETKITIHTDKHVLPALHGAGGSVQAPLYVLPLTKEHGDFAKAVQPHELDAQITGRVVLGGVFSREDLVKCSSLSVAGIIGASITKEDIAYLLEKKLMFPLVQVDTQVWKKLVEDSGKNVFLDADHGTILML